MDVTAAVFAVAVTVGSLAPSEPRDQVPSGATLASAAVVSEVMPAAEDGEQARPFNPAQFPALERASLTATASRRPSALVPLYASLAVLQGFDVYTTSQAMARGAVEVNPGMKPVAGRTWASAAVKAAATAGSVYFIERAWKQNRKGAVILATAINMATAAVVAHNTQVSKRR
jgi:hypothetical protein